MNPLNNATDVRQQYATAANLRTRISIHDKYSTNPEGFGNWIFSHYPLVAGMRVLELGCGTGDMWLGKERQIGVLEKLVLSDLSAGMVETATRHVGEHPHIEYRVIDIQDIPFPSGSFDVVIANMMLYHVPDIRKALREVRRVLKQGGFFCCATYGEHGIVEYISGLLSACGVTDTTNKNFTLQNGYPILRQVFSEVQKYTYSDALAVTDINDMIAYIRSMSAMTGLHTVPDSVLREVLTAHMADGVLHVPKEYGMFASS